jgi:hypothetical protein
MKYYFVLITFRTLTSLYLLTISFATAGFLTNDTIFAMKIIKDLFISILSEHFTGAVGINNG